MVTCDLVRIQLSEFMGFGPGHRSASLRRRAETVFGGAVTGCRPMDIK